MRLRADEDDAVDADIYFEKRSSHHRKLLFFVRPTIFNHLAPPKILPNFTPTTLTAAAMSKSITKVSQFPELKSRHILRNEYFVRTFFK